MKKLIFIILIFIALIIVLAYLGNRQYNQQLDEQLQGIIEPITDCPVCPQVITAKSIKANAIDYTGQKFENMTKIKLPESVSEIQIGSKVFKKEKYNPVNFEVNEDILRQIK